MGDEECMDWSQCSDHSRTIIHIDMDCFYAQVEMLKEPNLREQPLGVRQKNIVVTSNYIARAEGVSKCITVSEAVRRCPRLVLVSGEDLHDYRTASSQIHAFLLTFTPKVEKLGFDENFLDVTDLVDKREKSQNYVGEVKGNVVGDASEKCLCGCHDRLVIGSQIALEIRENLKKDLGYTSCCGVSYNKLLAKLVGSKHKPNNQTTLFPNGVSQFMLDIGEVSRIPSIGSRTKQSLHTIGVKTVEDLQNVEFIRLKNMVGQESATNLKNLSHGVDDTAVKTSTRPQTIGLEDGFRKISLECDVKDKFRVLLLRLMALVEEDGRLPLTVKVTVRKFDSVRKIGHKETKQSPVPSYLFTSPLSKLSDESTTKLLTVIMSLFHRIVNISKPFHLTLLGLAFTKFQDRCGNQSIASFLLKKRDLSVQSLTSFVSYTNLPESSDWSMPSCSKCESESEAEPSPKKTKLDVIIKKRKLSEEADLCSPSKLKVGELSLSGDCEETPPGADPEVFRALPPEIRQELIQDWKASLKNSVCTKPKQSKKQNLIHKYCIPNK